MSHNQSRIKVDILLIEYTIIINYINFLCRIYVLFLITLYELEVNSVQYICSCFKFYFIYLPLYCIILLLRCDTLFITYMYKDD